VLRSLGLNAAQGSKQLRWRSTGKHSREIARRLCCRGIHRQGHRRLRLLGWQMKCQTEANAAI
jgi:hypothetical protein